LSWPVGGASDLLGAGPVVCRGGEKWDPVQLLISCYFPFMKRELTESQNDTYWSKILCKIEDLLPLPIKFVWKSFCDEELNVNTLALTLCWQDCQLESQQAGSLYRFCMRVLHGLVWADEDSLWHKAGSFLLCVILSKECHD